MSNRQAIINIVFAISLAILAMVLASCLCCTAYGQTQLMNAEHLAKCRSKLPDVTVDRWQSFLRDPTTLIYSHNEMPKCYQFSGSFHSVNYNISGDASEDFKPHGDGGNANVDFPWRFAGGTDEAQRAGVASGFTMLWLPKQADGKPWPIVVWPADGRWQWLFPRNTIIGEVLLVWDSQKVSHCCEVRIRFRQDNYWDVDRLVPFPHRDDLLMALWKEGIGMPMRPTMRTERLRDTNHDRVAFDRVAYVETLPNIPEATAMKLLDETPFRSAMGGYWWTDGQRRIFAPTTRQRASVVPLGYRASHLGNDLVGCAACHNTTQVAADVFRNQGWYGFARGSDAIFSFHPVEPSSISGNGAGVPVRLRQSLVEGGMVARFDLAKHPKDRYQRLERGPLFRP
jgi:hypothetical protein